MARSISKYLNSTGMVPVNCLRSGQNLIQSQLGHLADDRIIFSNVTIENCGSAVVIGTRLPVPSIADLDICEFTEEEPAFVTRHIEARYLCSARKGYFSFDTLVNYRAAEGAVAGRLGDVQESRIWEIFRSRSGFFKSISSPGLIFENLSVAGNDRDVVGEYINNDYCSCSSLGVFSLERAEAIRDRETDPERKPGAYVTYDFGKMKRALLNHFSRDASLSKLSLLGREVTYGEKDRTWDVEQNFTFQQDRDGLAIWLSVAFVKSPGFQHEEEYRLLLVDETGPGALDNLAQKHQIPYSEAIAASIVASDFY